MITVSRQAVAGACLAAALLLRASTSRDTVPPAQRAIFVDRAVVVAAVEACGSAVLDGALDLAGEIAGQLKQF
ncbi:MAG: hypothetical protein KGJ78_17890 [Alphaproteobacteria bacterium]|nr:hypothetical protein [Alphaproteobacteria bacterium]